MKIGPRAQAIERRIFPSPGKEEYEYITHEGLHTVESLLEAIKVQRLSLDGDDTEKIRALGVSEEFFNAEERYLLGEIHGRSCYIPVGKLPSAQDIFLHNRDDMDDPLIGTYKPRLETTFYQWEETRICIIAVAYENEEEVVSNIYIGIPDFAYTDVEFPEDTAISAAEIMLELGKEKHIYQKV